MYHSFFLVVQPVPNFFLGSLWGSKFRVHKILLWKSWGDHKKFAIWFVKEAIIIYPAQ